MSTSRLEYTSFLVRLWRQPSVETDSPSTAGEWLVQVEHIPDGEKRYFTSLEYLFTYIREWVGEFPSASDKE